MNPIDPTPSDAEGSPLADDYRTSVENALQRLAEAGYVTIDGDAATLNGKGLQLLQDLVIAWSVQTFGITNVRSVRLSHLTSVAFGSTLVAAMNAVGGADTVDAEHAYQRALTAVRHLGKATKG